MTCDRIRRMLSFEPRGTILPRNLLARRHLRRCADCRRFWRALIEVDAALAARPLALPEGPLVTELPALREQSAHTLGGGPFSRAYWASGVLLTVCALVAGAYILRHWSASASAAVAPLGRPWVSTAWPSAASDWLSIEGGRMAQVVLAGMAGVLVTLVSAAIGFQASTRPDRPAGPAGDSPPPHRP
ncbi:MAG: hypothetical protein QME94_12005 [Anaerolineae bacterium]|nr:hypothetical protein [Anaerolineae bacterium]